MVDKDIGNKLRMRGLGLKPVERLFCHFNILNPDETFRGAKGGVCGSVPPIFIMHGSGPEIWILYFTGLFLINRLN